MASENLKQRIKDEPPTTTTNNNNKTRRGKKMAMAKRGLRSLAIAVAIPISLTLAATYLSGPNRTYRDVPKPFWFPPLWAMHLASLGSSFLMGLSAWLVWVDGGFHSQSSALPLYLASIVLSQLWNFVVFKLREPRVCLAICVSLLGALVGSCRNFRKVNPIAGDLIKLCLAWVVILMLMNFKLLYL